MSVCVCVCVCVCARVRVIIVIDCICLFFSFSCIYKQFLNFSLYYLFMNHILCPLRLY